MSRSFSTLRRSLLWVQLMGTLQMKIRFGFCVTTYDLCLYVYWETDVVEFLEILVEASYKLSKLKLFCSKERFMMDWRVFVQFHSLKTFYSPYEESKALADKLVQEAAAEGVSIVALYPGVVYGPGKMTKGNSIAEMVCAHFCVSGVPAIASKLSVSWI